MSTEPLPSSVDHSEPQQQELLPPSPDPMTEFNGPKGPEPTRFGDWERKGRCIDF